MHPSWPLTLFLQDHPMTQRKWLIGPWWSSLSPKYAHSPSKRPFLWLRKGGVAIYNYLGGGFQTFFKFSSHLGEMIQFSLAHICSNGLVGWNHQVDNYLLWWGVPSSKFPKKKMPGGKSNQGWGVGINPTWKIVKGNPSGFTNDSPKWPLQIWWEGLWNVYVTDVPGS